MADGEVPGWGDGAVRTGSIWLKVPTPLSVSIRMHQIKGVDPT